MLTLMSTTMMIYINLKQLGKIIAVPPHLVIQRIQLPQQSCSKIIYVAFNKKSKILDLSNIPPPGNKYICFQT